MISSRKIACPSCAVSLKIADTVPAGKPIKCPGCGNGFRVPAAKAEVAIPTATLLPPPRKAPTPVEEEDHFDENDEELEERPRPRKKKKLRPKKQAANVPLIAGMIVGVLVLIG